MSNLLELLAAKKRAREEELKELAKQEGSQSEQVTDSSVIKTMEELSILAKSLTSVPDEFIPNTKEAKIAHIAATQQNSKYLEALKASMEAGKRKQEVPASTALPQEHHKLSLAEKLALKKQAAEQQTLGQEEVSSSLPSAIAQQDPEAIFVDHQVPEAIKPTAEDFKEGETLAEQIAENAAKSNAVAVIKVGKDFMSLEDIKEELGKLAAKKLAIKTTLFDRKIANLEEKLIELETLIDLEREAQAPAAGTLADPSQDLTNGAADAEVSALLKEAIPVDLNKYQGAFSLNVVLNERQLMAKEMAMAGKSYCLIGPAGSGKTTAQRSVAEALLESDRLHTCDYKVQGGGGSRVEGPSFVAVAYTRRASANLARAIHKNPRLEEALRHNIMTVHALLEFEPVYFFDEEKKRESMRFEPQRTSMNPLTITHLAIEEASMLGLDLWLQLYAALPEGVQIIFIGDINQLPPVFGASILNYALVQLPVIELTEVYRNGGIILDNAHRILKGQEIIEGESVDPDTGKVSKFSIVRGKSEQQVGQEKMSQALGLMFKHWHDSGEYQPEEDMILSPFNKQALGTDNMNKWIAQFLGEKRKAIVFEVLAGFNKHYLAVGDRVMVNKQDGYITKISNNAQYQGQEPQLPGSDLSRFGMRVIGAGSGQDMDELGDILLGYTNFNLEELAEQNLERKQQASHLVDVLLESGQLLTLSAAGDFGPQVFSLGYVLTVHKAQGCEFRKVFIIMHKDHSVMLCRELFYTAETRAREECVVIAKDWIIAKAIKAQKIKGDSLQDKIEYFNSGAVDMTGGITCTK